MSSSESSADQYSTSPYLSEGTFLAGRYRVVGQLGSGSSGTVYLADDLCCSRQVALKTPCTKHEADVLRQLRHPSIPEFYDFFEDEEGGWGRLVMEYIPGENFSSCRLNGQEVLAVGIQLCSALHYLHSCAFLYADWHGGNVRISRSPTGAPKAYLIDFGCAEQLAPKSRTISNFASDRWRLAELLARRGGGREVEAWADEVASSPTLTAAGMRRRLRKMAGRAQGHA